MTTLYEILGLGQRATSEQVKQAYILQSEKLKNEDQTPEQNKAQLMAVKEAYSVLSSSVRRQAYDDKLNKANQVTYEVAETNPLPWLQILLITAALLAGGIYYYKIQENKARVEQLALEAAKAKADAEKAQLQAEAEQAGLLKAKLFEQQQAVENQRRETEQARREGQQIHWTLEQQAERAARDRDQAERQAKYEQVREEQAARFRVQNQNAAMQRALNIPIRRGS